MNCIYLRNNLRIENNELFELLNSKNNKDILILIIIDEYQVKENEQNEHYHSKLASNFFLDCVNKLKNYYSDYNFLIVNKPVSESFYSLYSKLIHNYKIEKIAYFNYYSQYALKRDAELSKACKDCNCELKSIDESIFQIDKTYFSFSAYHKKTLSLPQPNLDLTLLDKRAQYFNFQLPSIDFLNNYSLNNNINTKTSGLSRFIKLGIISNKELYSCVNNLNIDNIQKGKFLKQLIWKEYFSNLQKHYKWNPSKITSILPSAYQNISWTNNEYFAKMLWSGKTGYPIIDAIAKELLNEGYVNNISRLLIADFSIKILKQDPFEAKWGAMNVFSKLLVDCCSANNTGNFLWVIGFLDNSAKRFTKKDKIPSRIFNPCLIQKYDAQLKGIRKHVRQLDQLTNEEVLNWHKDYRSLIKKYNLDSNEINYKPIVNYDTQKSIWISKFSK